jgi:hypothetical protein
MRRVVALSALLLALVACKEGGIPARQFDPETTVSSAVRIDIDGRVMVPTDLNGDGQITGDIEMGS